MAMRRPSEEYSGVSSTSRPGNIDAASPPTARMPPFRNGAARFKA